MRCTYFQGPWKGIGAAIELVSEETGKSVAEIMRIGGDYVVQHYHRTGQLPESPRLRAPSKRTRRVGGAVNVSDRTPKSPSLDDLHRASIEARDTVNRMRHAWVEFGLKYGEHAKQVAKNGGHGYALWLRLKLAIEREKVAVEKVAEARLAMTPTFKRKEVV
jgi:hypothetical protein